MSKVTHSLNRVEFGDYQCFSGGLQSAKRRWQLEGAWTRSCRTSHHTCLHRGDAIKQRSKVAITKKRSPLYRCTGKYQWFSNLHGQTSRQIKSVGRSWWSASLSACLSVCWSISLSVGWSVCWSVGLLVERSSCSHKSVGQLVKSSGSALFSLQSVSCHIFSSSEVKRTP